MRRDQGGEHVVAAVAGAAVAVLPAVVGGEQVVEGGQQVVVAARAGLQHGDAGGGVGDENVEQAVAAGGGAGEELLAGARQVRDALGRTRGDVQDRGGEGIGHASIFAPLA